MQLPVHVVFLLFGVERSIDRVGRRGGHQCLLSEACFSCGFWLSLTQIRGLICMAVGEILYTGRGISKGTIQAGGWRIYGGLEVEVREGHMTMTAPT